MIKNYYNFFNHTVGHATNNHVFYVVIITTTTSYLPLFDLKTSTAAAHIIAKNKLYSHIHAHEIEIF